MTSLPTTRVAWGVVGTVLAALLLGLLTWAAGVGPRSGDGEQLPPGPVILVGAPGLSWDDIDEESTPTLSRWERDGAAAALVVRGAYAVTCPSDGWLTLGTGQRVAPEAPGEPRSAGCPQPPDLDVITGADGRAGVVQVPGWQGWQQRADTQPVTAQLGALTEAVDAAGGCVEGNGTAAALAAADSSGQALWTPDWREADLGRCAVHLIDAGPIGDGPIGADSAAQVRSRAAALDAEVAEITAAAPDGTTIIVAGLGDAADRPGLRALLMWTVGDEAGSAGSSGLSGAITSPATRQPGVTQTTDLTATLIVAAGGTLPVEVSGSPIRVLTDRTPAQADVRDIAIGGTLSEVVSGPVITGLGISLLLAIGIAAALRRRKATAVALTAMMTAPVATYLVEMVPWWRLASTEATGGELWRAGAALAAATVALIAVLTAAAWAGPWRDRWAVPPLLIGALTLVVVSVEILWGTRLSLTAAFGAPLVTAGRFYGAGNSAAGILLGALAVVMVIAGAALARDRRRRSAAVALGAIGLLVALIDGAPQWGADFGGVPPLIVTAGLIALPVAGVRVTLLRAGLIGAAGAAAAGAIMLLDWMRPAEHRSHLGDFVQSVIDGGAWDIVVRKFDENARMLTQYPVSWIGLAALVLLIWMVVAPRSRVGGPLAPLWDLPVLRAGAIAVLAGGLIGWAINDSGIGLIGLALVLAAPALAIVRISLPPESTPTSPGQL